MVTLLDGTEVDSASEAWRLECHHRGTHVDRLMAMPRVWQRREYLAGIGNREGDEARRRLEAAFLLAWERREAGNGR